MIDIALIRSSPEIIINDLKKRNDPEKLKWVESVKKIDDEWRVLKQNEDELRHKLNVISDEIKKSKDKKIIQHKISEAKSLSAEIQGLSVKQESLKQEIDFFLLRFPNILDETVPLGKSPDNNVVIKEHGGKTKFDFKPKDHIELLDLLDIADIERAGKVAGARFYYLKNEGVLLDHALQSFALDFMLKKGFALFRTPELLRQGALLSAIPFSDFEEVIYKVENEDLYLIGTAEHPLTAFHSDELLLKKFLPLKYAGVSNCYRKEAGSHGKDTKGIYRVHEFRKVEQYVLCLPEDSKKIHSELLKNAEEIFQLLEIPYRIVDICSADIGTVAAKKFDIEAWLPARGNYGEVVSCSNCTDYQARRGNIRFLDPDGKPKFVHTLNSTVLATTRAIVALLENHQQKDGSVLIPKALQPFMHGIKKIVPKPKVKLTV